MMWNDAIRRPLAALALIALLAPVTLRAQAAAAAAGEGFGTIAVRIRPGAIAQAELTAKPQSFKNPEQIIDEGKFQPDEDSSRILTLDRAPATGTKYLILDVRLGANRSIGKHDYLMRIDGRDYKALAIGNEGAPYDIRRTEIRHEIKSGDPSLLKTMLDVRLLYEVPPTAREGTLVPVLKQAIPQSEVSFKFSVSKE